MSHTNAAQVPITYPCPSWCYAAHANAANAPTTRRLMQLKAEYAGKGALPEAVAAFMDVPRLIALRVRQAAALRAAVGLPSDATTVYR